MAVQNSMELHERRRESEEILANFKRIKIPTDEGYLTNVVTSSEGKGIPLKGNRKPLPREQIKCFDIWVLVRLASEPYLIFLGS